MFLVLCSIALKNKSGELFPILVTRLEKMVIYQTEPFARKHSLIVIALGLLVEQRNK